MTSAPHRYWLLESFLESHQSDATLLAEIQTHLLRPMFC